MAAKQQEAPRKMLRPKKPTKGIRKKRRTSASKYGKEEILTEHQHTWARSLTASLSGWRNRQKFYKDHLEAQFQAEMKIMATEEANDAKYRAECEAEEKEEAEKKAIEQAEAEEEKAKRWRHKAREMHRAGRGVRREKHQYYGWDQEDEKYPRDLETERLTAMMKARRIAKRKAEARAKGLDENDVYDSDRNDSDRNDSDDSDLDSSGDSEVVDQAGFRSLSRSPVRTAPVTEQAVVVDWREKARLGVIKKKLSVTKEWGAITWNQKSNIQERLLVLEDDGYDIRELEDGKMTSEQVTAIILDRAAVKQQLASRAAQPVVRTEQFSSSQGESVDLPSARLDPALMQQFSGPAGQDILQGPISEPLLASTSSTGSSKSSHRRSKNGETQDSTQPFSFDEPYYPQASRRLKRKRDNSPELGADVKEGLSGLVCKKRKVGLITEHDFAAQALQNIRRAVIREVFRSVRSVVSKALPPSQIEFFVEAPPVDASRGTIHVSSLNYLYPETVRRESTNSPYTISSHAFDNVVAELHFLTGTTEDDSIIQIYNPDLNDDLVFTPITQERIKPNTQDLQHQAPSIAITIEKGAQMTVRGDAIVLAGLLKVLRERALLHRAELEWDGLCLQRPNEMSWHLSPQTQDTFSGIETRLQRGSGTGSVSIVVGVKPL